MRIGSRTRTNTFSVRAGAPKLAIPPHNSLSVHSALSSNIIRDASLMTVPQKDWGGVKNGAKGRLAATEVAEVERSCRTRLMHSVTRDWDRREKDS